MPLYRALAPLSFVNDQGRVTNITQVGSVFPASTAQAATIPESSIEYVGSGGNPRLAPRVGVLLFDAVSEFPEVGDRFTLYLGESEGALYRWATDEYVPLIPAE